ncbi:MAG: hypothetical protein HC817_07630 [Saprospiraceae bacterium]|nr:hypothetical protein [Saprospiraceae bacterium]
MQLTSEWLNTQAAIEGLRDKIRRNPADFKAKLQLAMAYVQQSRITGDHAFFDDAALQLAHEILEKEPKNFDALAIKATVLLSQHHFTEGATLAENIIQTYPDAAFGYGLLCDAYVELGYYEKAMAAADKMNAIRPDLRSYSRIAYLREIFGNLEGAKMAMEMAVNAGVAGLEQTEWCRTQLAKLYELTGETAKAQELYHISLITRPDYPYALAGLARLNTNLDSAVIQLEKAHKMMVDASFSDDLSDVYLIHNQRVKSEQGDKKNH